jgi:hypothetical protein
LLELKKLSASILSKNARMAKPEEVQRWVRNERIFQATQAAVGLTLILLGLTLYRAPLFCLVTAVVVYTLHLVIAVTIDPLSLNFRLYQVSILSAAMLGAIRAAKRFRRSSKSASGDTQAHENRQPSEMPQLHHIPALVQQSLEQPLLIEVYAPAPLQRSALVWCLIALGMAGVAVFTGQTVFAWLAIPPAMMGIALAIMQPGPFSCRFRGYRSGSPPTQAHDDPLGKDRGDLNQGQATTRPFRTFSFKLPDQCGTLGRQLGDTRNHRPPF